MSSVCLNSFVQADVFKYSSISVKATRPKHVKMSGSHSEDSCFSDAVVMTSTQTARISSAQGLELPQLPGLIETLAQCLGLFADKKMKTPGSNGAAQLRATRMLVVHKYDLSTEGPLPICQGNEHAAQH